MSSKSSASSARERREAQREALRVQRQREQRRQRTVLIATIATAAAVVIALVAGAAWLILQSGRASDSGPVVAPKGMSTDQSAYVLGREDAPVTVDLYVDFMCPVCGVFHKINGADLDQLINDGKIKLNLHTRTFLDAQSTTGDYSTRAANAAACVYSEKPEKLWAYQDELLAHQPEEGTAGLTNAKLTELAVKAGAPESVSSCIADQPYAPWLHQVVEKDAQRNDVRGTPYVAINGEAFNNWNVPGALAQRIDQVSKSGGAGASDGGSAG